MSQQLNEMASLEDILNYWERLEISEISWMPYTSKTNFRYGVWFNKQKKTQLYFDSKPIDQTARSLIKLRKKDTCLTTVFKLFAFLRGVESSLAFKLKKIMMVENIRNEQAYIEPWHPNAFYVLPKIHDDKTFGLLPSFQLHEIVDAKILIGEAAKTWDAIAKTVVLLEPPIILTADIDPDYMKAKYCYKEGGNQTIKNRSLNENNL